MLVILAALVLIALGAAGVYRPEPRACVEAPAGRSHVQDAPAIDPTMAAVCERACATRLAYDPGDVVTQPGAVVGWLTRCPVSGVVFAVTTGSARVDHAGKTYYLCCDRCSGKFRDAPARFVAR
jgi:YHS domain-containing protein